MGIVPPTGNHWRVPRLQPGTLVESMKRRILFRHVRVLLLIPALCLLVAGLFASQGVLAQAQEAAVDLPSIDPAQLTFEERRDLLGRLSDAQVRELVRELIATADTPGTEAETGFAGELTEAGEQLRSAIQRWAGAIGQLPGVVTAILGAMTPDGGGAVDLLLVFLLIALVIGGGLLGGHAFRRATANWRGHQLTPADDFLTRMGHASLRLGWQSLDVAIFVAVSAAIFLLAWQGHQPNRLLIVYLVTGIALIQMAVRVSTLLWSPHSGDMRLITVSDTDAQRLHRAFVWIVALGVIQFYLAKYLRVIGLSNDLVQLVALSLGTAYIATINIWMWKLRLPLRDAILHREHGRGALVPLFARLWPLLYGVLTVAIYLTAVATAVTPRNAVSGASFYTLALAIALPFALGFAGSLVNALFDRYAPPQPVTIGDRITSRSGLRRPLTRLVQALIVVAAIIQTGAWWGLDFVTFFDSLLGTRFGQSLLQIVAAVIVAYALWVMARRAIDPHIEDAAPDGEADDMGGVGVSRIATLLPLLRKTILVALLVMTSMIALSALGVNIGPLLAGAGVIGIAVGFGAQSLITDIISGVFFLMDDAFRRGEYVEIGGIRGTVEQISLRSFQLRHHNGPLHTVPYGQIKSITNYSRDYAIMKFEIRVPFETDVDRVRKLIKKVGQEMMQDPELAPMLLDPLKSQGVNRMDDSAFIVRCKFTAKPGKQFLARRVAYTRIQEAFRREGIQFAPKRVIVETISPNPDPALVAGAALADDKDNDKPGA